MREFQGLTEAVVTKLEAIGTENRKKLDELGLTLEQKQEVTKIIERGVHMVTLYTLTPMVEGMAEALQENLDAEHPSHSHH